MSARGVVAPKLVTKEFTVSLSSCIVIGRASKMLMISYDYEVKLHSVDENCSTKT